jgi:subtilisin-like proprotein convertase family protein
MWQSATGKTTRITSLLSLIVLIAVVAMPAQARVKEDNHQQMIAIGQEMEALKAQGLEENARYQELKALYQTLSAQMGGDDPARIFSPSTPDRTLALVRPQFAPPSPPDSTTTTTNFANTTPVAIPTGPAVVTSTITVSGAGAYLWDLDLTTFITHTFAADLDITIASPAGTVVTLTTDNGAGNDNVFNGTLWDDDANPAGQVPYTTNNGLATDHAYTNLTLASPLVPEEALGAFIGENPNGTWTLTISDDLAGDGGSLANWSLAFVTCSDVNDAPSFTANDPPTVNEDAGAQSVPGWVTSFSPGPANEATQTVLAYTVSNVSNAALFSVAPAVANDGTLTYTSAPNANGGSTFDVVVQDSGGTINGGVDTSAVQTFTITVNPVNDQPSFTGSNQTVNEDAGAQTVANWATFAPGGGADEAGQTATYTVSNLSNAALFSVAPSVDASGTLIYTPAPNVNGTSTFDVVVQDSGGTANGGVNTSATQTFTITVNPVNDAPTAISQTLTTAEDTALPITLSGADIDGNPLTFAVATQPANGTLSGTAPNLTYTPNANYTGPDSFTFTANDGTVTSSPATVSITVNPAADDGDGIPDSIEDQAPNNGDGNNDGIPDRNQGFVTSLAAFNGAIITFANEATQFQQLGFTALPPPTDAPADLSFPFGVVGFTLQGVPANGTVAMTLYVPATPTVQDYFKRDSQGQWQSIVSTVTPVGAQQRIVFSLTDNDAFDADTAPGVIGDPGGPAVRAPIAIPTLDQWAQMLAALLLASLGWLRIRRRLERV